MDNKELIEAHYNATAMCSFMHHMKSVSPTYKQIIEKGREILPDILKFLRDNENVGMSIIMLILEITEYKESPYTPEEITNDEGEIIKGFVGFNVTEAKEAWIKWGEKQKFI